MVRINHWDKDENAKPRVFSISKAGVLIAMGGVFLLHLVLESSSFSKTKGTAPSSMLKKSIGVGWQPKSGATVCNEATGDIDPELFNGDIDPELFKSQSGEDRVLLDNFFGGLCEGTYLEMGGLDGVLFSNTFLFHHGLQWKGVLVEASPKNFKQLSINRPNEIATVHAGVCSEAKDLHWVEGKSANVGGFLEFASESFQKQWFPEESKRDVQVVLCKPLRTLLSEQVGSEFFFDFFSLDIEGGEFAALQSLDFEQVSFGVIFVEADAHNVRKNMALRMLLESNGYQFLMEEKRSYWFVNRDFANIYQHLIYKP